MSRTLQVLEKKPSSVEEAIELDKRLLYHKISAEIHKEIIDDPLLTKANIVVHGVSVTLEENILEQLREYKYREDNSPSIILYTDPEWIALSYLPIRAVSALFHPIPLSQVWEAVVKKFGEPVEEKATRQAIVALFKPVKTKYKVNGDVAPEDYEVRPCIAFSYNFAERSFEMGFVVGVFNCMNQIFAFFGGETRFIHNVYQVEAKGFTIETAIENLMNQLTTLEDAIEKAQNTPLTGFGAPVLYWKGTRAKTRVLTKVYEQHDLLCQIKGGSDKLTLWDGVMNLTQVSTHQIPNYNTAVDLSMAAGSLLLKTGHLRPYDFVKALGYYLEKKEKTKFQQRTQETPIFQRINLLPLMHYSIAVIDSLFRKEETNLEKAKVEANKTDCPRCNSHNVEITDYKLGGTYQCYDCKAYWTRVGQSEKPEPGDVRIKGTPPGLVDLEEESKEEAPNCENCGKQTKETNVRQLLTDKGKWLNFCNNTCANEFKGWKV